MVTLQDNVKVLIEEENENDTLDTL